MKSLDVHAFASLIALVEEGHVSRAAQRMGVGQPAMSETLARLREAFGDPLLVRTRGGMTATPRAEHVTATAREILALVERAIAGNEGFDAARAHADFRLVALNSLSFSLLPHIVSRLEREAPGIRVLVQPGDMRRTREMLEADDCDMVIGFPPKVSVGLHAVPLTRLRLCCIARRDHPEIRGKVTLTQFARYPHVVLGAGPVPVSAIESTIERSLRVHRITRRVGARVPDLLITPAVVAETNFLATVPERVAASFADSLGIQLLKLPFSLVDPSVLMVWHERSQRDPGHRWFRHVIRDVARSVLSGRAPS